MNRCSKFLLAAVVAATSSSLFAEQITWTWTGAGSGWADAANWTHSGTTTATYPQPDDIVTIPAGKTAYVYDDDITILSATTGVVMKAKSNNQISRIVFDLENDHEIAIPVGTAVSGADAYVNDAQLIKTGTGSLWLNSKRSLYSYRINLVVSNGVLRLPQVTDNLRNQFYSSIRVESPGILMPVTTSVPLEDHHDAHTWSSFWGNGTITNPTDSVIALYANYSSSSANVPTFSGRVDGKINVRNDGNTFYQNFTGTGGTCSGAAILTKGAILGMGELGGATDNTGNSGRNYGSLGLSDIKFNGENDLYDTAKVLYLGTGGVSYSLVYASGKNSYIHLDAGETGGLDFRGRFRFSDRPVVRLRLDAAGSLDNIFRGDITVKSSGSAYVTKTGPGTWSFQAPKKSFNGAIAVEEGTLKFDSIDMAGQQSALGLGSLLKENIITNSLESAADVDYAYLLGDGTHTGTMEYTGAEDAITDRRFAVNGSGRISSTGGALKILKAAGKSPTANTLALGGSAEDCELVDLDGESVKLVKEGTGDWTVSGNVDSLDGVEVKEGLLDLGKVAENYTWFRLTVMDKYSRVSNLTDNSYVDLGRLGLFNATGGVVNAGCETNLTKNGRHLLLNPGEYCLGFPEGSANDASYLYNTDSYRLCYFEPTENGGSQFSFFRVRYKKNGSTAQYKWPDLNDPDSWLTITLRLPEGAEKVTSYDLSSRWDYTDSSSGNGANAIDAWKLEGSLDGVHWTLLHQMDDYHAKPEYVRSDAPNRWMIGSGKAYNIAGSLHHTDGVAIADPVRPTRYANGVGPVKVDAGATLQTGDPIALDELELDVANATAGTLKGFTFASTGTLHLTGTGRLPQLLEVAIDLGDASATAVSGWSVTYNGNPIAHRTVSYDASAKKLTVIGPGLQLYLR